MAVKVGDFVRGAYSNGLDLITCQTACIITALPEDRPHMAEVRIVGATKEAREYWRKYLANSKYIGRRYMVSKSKLALLVLRQVTE